MQVPQHLPSIQIRSKCALMYNQYIGDRKTKLNPSLNNFDSPEIKTYSGEMREHARKRLARAVSLLNQCSPWKKVPSPITEAIIDFKLSFITLTFPDSKLIDGKSGYINALYPFLRVIKARYPNFLYVYKAELQERGQLHYHITANECIPHQVIRQCWNKILSAAGYLDEFIAKNGRNDAPSTEIKAVQNISDIESYLVKYIAKKDKEGRSIGGKVWGCSRELQGRGYFTDVLNSVNTAAIEALERSKKVVVKVLERVTVVRFREGSPLAILSKNQFEAYGDYLNDILTGVKQKVKKFTATVAELEEKVLVRVEKPKINSQLTLSL